jgi:circadian clock protein KaiC
VRGTNALLMGPAGSGKSSLAMQYVSAAAARGERCAMYLFDENMLTMLARADGIGLPLRKQIESGIVSVRQLDPAEVPPGEFVSLVRAEVEKNGAHLVIVDSLNGYMNAMPEERFLILHMHELLMYLAQRGVVTLVLMAQHGMLGKMESQIDVSYLSDAVVLFRYFEAHGAIRLALSVVKKRTGTHERTIREMNITAKGVHVGKPLTEFHGVLSGVPTYVGKSEPLMGKNAG